MKVNQRSKCVNYVRFFKNYVTFEAEVFRNFANRTTLSRGLSSIFKDKNYFPDVHEAFREV